MADDVGCLFPCILDRVLTLAAVPGVDVVLLCASLTGICCDTSCRLSSATLATTCCKSMFVALIFILVFELLANEASENSWSTTSQTDLLGC